ncbi:GDH/6PGL endoplasmic bifunctional protein-like isoform X2 [Dreissena polymorpha]|uniref:Uncharacterized protein n=3 Tax=Dreissena polymorpha TaxID=45954 RepID=A0A9D4MIY7_DREPO|nr:GDH/6PGL endoplasmic bifunctional protein-like isoform X2 [Dreissena polymorpha]XP_052269045.1 GDH/6PGL endoplasmic bifunctional protein-like isoform X2 [Dreissena polymorpha]XP_052269052.1 GDH/6PGL endoplasmic bifunctional protein-like isoform X2 [Dreissena polymorpha]XP_052269059.1 GDH/6PGL endoplasmic bifunctional protein-like isoform X2 [Dreissena polymorpha]XP_052269061.1 GDH/6PGL endoplasmic bifunctional protein-like isoform X2 [Dreissena polymorpha]XP_052269062.1 GDH/6PGL endoplasmic
MCSLVLFILLLESTCCHAVRHTNIVIVGGFGDLAKKYLWSGALNLFVNNHNENATISFYGAARVSVEDGTKILHNILESVQCETKDNSCMKLRPAFLARSHYVLLKTKDHYQAFCGTLYSLSIESSVSMRNIFYLSVPSSSYEDVAKLIKENCNFSSTQIVLEKPFGLDKSSAVKQVNNIGKFFVSDEVWRVDHYLAKSVTKQILKFREVNRGELEKLLNNQYVDRVEVVMKERIGVSGRVDFYDQTGVIRDVMQNHLTELLALVTMELPGNVSDSRAVEQSKLAVLHRVASVDSKAVVTGQYRKYLAEAKEELVNTNQSHMTPTFAAALLHIQKLRWQNVPLIIMSGKHMDERSSYVRILFREKDFCVSGCADGNSTFMKYPRQMVFQISHGSVPSAGILVSRSLFTPKWPSGMKDLPMTSKDSLIHGQSPGDFYYGVPVNDLPAYFTVMSDLYHNVRETFVTAERLLTLWDIWDQSVQSSSLVIPRLYKEYDASSLNFSVEGFKLEFIEKEIRVYLESGEMSKQSIIPPEFRNSTLHVTEINKLIQILCDDIFEIATEAIRERGNFHIAFSGGQTAVNFFEKLAKEYPQFPWQHTHIWQVDERCVPYSTTESNFFSLHEHLIKFVDIPYFNVHPMPVNLGGKTCDISSRADTVYENEIVSLISGLKYDFIVLGLGTDAHVASLFPNSIHLHDNERLVSYSSAPEGFQTQARMTVLPTLVNHAHNVGILVTGHNKHEILHAISELTMKNEKYPVTFIAPVNGTLVWYVDFNAWLGSTGNAD